MLKSEDTAAFSAAGKIRNKRTDTVVIDRDNTIVIEAEHKKGKKTIDRSFEVLY